MGSEKSTTTIDNTQKVTPTPEETEANKLQLEQMRKTSGPQTDVQLAGLDLIKQLLTGTTPLPGFFGTMAQGISPEAISQQGTSMALNAMPGFQSMGLADSGVAAKEISKDISNNLLFPAEQFNIGSLQNMLNLALSGQAQVQSPIQANQSMLNNQLAGLRTVQSSGTTTQKSMNPFLKSFQTSLGSSLGNPKFSAGPFSFGGS